MLPQMFCAAFKEHHCCRGGKQRTLHGSCPTEISDQTEDVDCVPLSEVSTLGTLKRAHKSLCTLQRSNRRLWGQLPPIWWPWPPWWRDRWDQMSYGPVLYPHAHVRIFFWQLPRAQALRALWLWTADIWWKKRPNVQHHTRHTNLLSTPVFLWLSYQDEIAACSMSTPVYEEF
jgi:hypothetical protein